MDRKQRRRQLARRRAHAARPDRPRNVISRERYSEVKQGHIVPVVYQRNFADNDQVALHVDGRPCVPANVSKTATLGAFYRRTRPDGGQIDDVEASLGFIEDAVRPVFEDILAGGNLIVEHKHVLAQFFGIQMVRGPAFFAQRTTLIEDLVAELDATHLRSALLREVGGDLTVARARVRVRDVYLSQTQQLIAMLTTSFKLASVIGSMRWHVLRFDDPVVAYSDHPVVVWPLDVATSAPFSTPKLAPLDAVEVRVPLSPHLALLMTWADEPDDGTPVAATHAHAGELNAFTVGQAERQWMHRLGIEAPIAAGQFAPLSRLFEPRYDATAVQASLRRQAAARYLHRVRRKRFLDDIEIVQISRGADASAPST